MVHAGPGLDLVMGNAGQDFIFLGTDMGSEVFAGEGNDFIYGNKNAERILGNEGNDWIETGTFDGAPGDNFDEIFARDGVDGHDVFLGDGGFDEFIAEGGDDIMVGSPGRGKMAGMSGFDWATYKDSTFAVDADFTRGIVFDENPTPPQFGTLDAYESVEGLSGSTLQRHPDRRRHHRRRAAAVRPGRHGRLPRQRADDGRHRADRRPAGGPGLTGAVTRCGNASSTAPATSSSAATAAT